MKSFRTYLAIIIILSCTASKLLAFQVTGGSEVQIERSVDSILAQASTLEGDTAKIDLLIKSAWSYARNQPEIALAIIDSLDFYYQDTSFLYNRYRFYYYQGIIYKNLGNVKESEKHLQRFIKIMKAKGVSRSVMAAQQALGSLYTDNHDYKKAITLYINSLDFLDSQKDSSSLARTYTRLGYFLSKVGDYEQALSYSAMACEIMKTNADKQQYINVLNDRGIIFESMEKWDSMFHYYHKGYELSYEYGDIINKLYANYNLGSGYLKAEKYENARPYFAKSLLLSQQSSDRSMELYSNLGLAQVAAAKQQYQLAIQHLEELSNDTELSTELINEQEKLRSDVYAKLGKYKLAYLSHLKHKVAADSLSAKITAAELLAIENKYDRNKKELEIQGLSSSRDIAELRAQKVSSRNILLAGGLLLTLLTLGVIAFLFTLNKKKSRELSNKNSIISQALEEKEILIKEIHHRVKNNLQIVSSLLSLQSRTTADSSATQALEDSQQRVLSMAIIHQHLYTGDSMTCINMEDYLKNLCHNVYAAHSLSQDQIALHLHIEPIKLDINTVVPLGLIFNELITNSCKYAFPKAQHGNITIFLKEYDHILMARVSDDGVGRKSDKVGFGSKLINVLAKKMDATVTEDYSDGFSYQIDIRNYEKV